jgi:hypothetical protein
MSDQRSDAAGFVAATVRRDRFDPETAGAVAAHDATAPAADQPATFPVTLPRPHCGPVG